MLERWFAWTNEPATKRLIFQDLFFFHNFLQNSLQKSFQSIFLFLYDFTNIKIKSLSAHGSLHEEKENNVWSISHLVAGLFVQTNQQTSVIY